jgi:hypothetical protein
MFILFTSKMFFMFTAWIGAVQDLVSSFSRLIDDGGHVGQMA